MIRTSTKIYLAILGISFIFLGIICLLHPQATLLSVALFIGISTLVSGISSLCLWVRARKVLPQSGTILFTGIVEIILGFIFLNHGPATAVALAIVFSCWLLIEGISLAVKSSDFKDAGFKFWWVICLVGIAVAFLGIFSMKNPVVNGSDVMGFLVGIAVILIGLMELLGLAGINKFQKKHLEWIDDSVDEQ